MAKADLRFDYPEHGCGFEFDDHRPLFRLIVRSSDQRAHTATLTPADFDRVERIEDGYAARLTFSEPRGTSALTVTVELHRSGSEITGSLQVESDGGLIVREAQFPYVVWEQVEAFDSLLMSTSWGDNIQRPTDTIRERCGGKISYIYPSMLAMQYMVLHNPGRSVYISAYSTSDESFIMTAECLPRESLALSINHFPFLSKGMWRSPEVGVAVLEGGWHAAADLYRSHMGDKFAAPDSPQWMKDGFHGWVQVGMKHEGKPANFHYSDLPGIFRRIQDTGLDTMHVFGWNGCGHDTEYPDFNTNPELGTSQDLRRSLDEIRAMGGHAILYTNGRLVDPESDYYHSEGGDQCVCLNEDGEPIIERYGTTPEFRIVCPVCGSYQDYLLAQIDKIMRDYGAHAIQIDQISCNWGSLCFDDRHPHPTPASNFLPGLSTMLSRIRKLHKDADPDFFTWCEGCHERFGQFYDVNQGHGEEFTWQVGESTPEQFKYNYPDYPVTGISDGIQKLCYTFAQGKPFDFHLPNLDDPRFVGLLKSFISVRKHEPDYFLRGIFRDNAGLSISDGARAFRIDKRDGSGSLVNIWIPGLTPGREAATSLRFAEHHKACRTIYPDSLTVERDGSWLDLRWQEPVAVVAFEE